MLNIQTHSTSGCLVVHVLQLQPDMVQPAEDNHGLPQHTQPSILTNSRLKSFQITDSDHAVNKPSEHKPLLNQPAAASHCRSHSLHLGFVHVTHVTLSCHQLLLVLSRQLRTQSCQLPTHQLDYSLL